MKSLLCILIFVCGISGIAQDKFTAGEDLRITPLVNGTLLVPETGGQPPLVIILGGSGPVDRDGNQMMTKSNALRFLAQGLYKEGIASFRYDKRIVTLMKQGDVDESTISFNDFVSDAQTVLNFFKQQRPFDRIAVLGHSQGSLVGMLVARGQADGFVSIAGAGQTIDDVIVDQLSKQAPGLKENARQSFDEMRETGLTKNYSPGLSSIFRPSLQPFLISWMKHDPADLISGLEIPVLIINGDKDLQVQVSEAQKLHAAKPGAQLHIIPNMNHVLKEVQGDDIENSKTYNEPKRPLHPELLPIITAFVKKL